MRKPEYILKGFMSKWDRKDLIIFIVTFTIGVCLYIRMITQWMANPDCVWEGLVLKKNYAWESALGRFGIEIINKFKGFFQYPAIQTIFNIFLMACIAVLLINMFEVKNVYIGCLIGALLVLSPSFCSTLTYYYAADSYTLAYCLAVLFVYILIYKQGKLWLLISSAFLAFSMLIYQAYIGTAITLCLLYLLYLLLCKAADWKIILRRSGRFLAGGVLGTAGYLVAFRFFCFIYYVTPVSARGFDSMGKTFFLNLPASVVNAYRGFYDYFLTDNLYNNTWHLRGKTNFVVLSLLLAAIMISVVKRHIYKNWRQALLTLILLVLLPAAFMSIVMLAPEVSIYDVTGILMLPHMNFLYIFLLILVFTEGEDSVRAALQWASLGACGWIVFTLGLYTQVFQNCMELDMNRSYALAQRIVIEVEALPDYTPGMKLVIGGSPEQGNYPRSYDEMYYVVKGTAAVYGYFWDSHNGRQNCWNNFLRQYLGVQYSTCSGDELSLIENSTEYADMPFFPAEGSVRMFGDTAVVKLSSF